LETIQTITASYSGIFSGNGEADPLSEQWGWYVTLDNATGGKGDYLAIQKMYDVNVIEFLNHISYIVDKGQHLENRYNNSR
jgi:hypothetical protein